MDDAADLAAEDKVPALNERLAAVTRRVETKDAIYGPDLSFSPE